MLILTRSEVAARLSCVLAALVTIIRRQLPTEVALDEDDGMPQPCVVNLDNVTSTPTVFLVTRITRLGPERMRQVCDSLAHATGC